MFILLLPRQRLAVMQLIFTSLCPRTPLWLCLLIAAFPCCAGLDAGDVWSGKIWDMAQSARDKHAFNSDRLMQHIWQHPDRADQFVDCDILADSETEKHFQFLNLYDADDAREDLLSGLPGDGYVRGMWPLKPSERLMGRMAATVHYKISKEVDAESTSAFRKAIDRWQTAASVQFMKSSQKPYLEVVLDGGCFATLGYHPTEPRKLSLHPGRCTETVIVHLLGHVLGLPHPTSIVGRTNDLYLMPHHAAPRSMGVLSTRAGAAFDPFDIMAVDPWFCGVSNRTTWRPLSPSRYRWLAVVGRWDLAKYGNPERRSASTGLLQREIQLKSGTDGCRDRCADPCQEFLTNACSCRRPFDELTDAVYQKLGEKQWLFDMGKDFPLRAGGYLKERLLDAPKTRVFFHSTDDDGKDKKDDSGTKCWQCSTIVFTMHTRDVFDSKENQLIALGSRCTLFSMEVNGAIEEAWYRLCMHDLLHNYDGDVEVAFRGPGSILIRYFGSEDVFPDFHKSFKETVDFSWDTDRLVGCKCSNPPSAEVQYSVSKK